VARAIVGKPVVIISRYWREPARELSYVIRSLAGAASRHGEVTVLVPGEPARPLADGAFDVGFVGTGDDGDWPSPEVASWTSSVPRDATVVVDELNPALHALLARKCRGHRVYALSRCPDDLRHASSSDLQIVPSSSSAKGPLVGMHVPVNPLAATHRHNGFGFVDYLLVLSDRFGDHELPPDGAAWLTAGLHRANVVVVENAKASVWRGRALRGVISVDSRTDLWRLVAHARVCVDLGPGSFIARECVESLRYGTPIIVPEQAPAAAAHAVAGGGLTFDSMADLLHCAKRFDDPGFRSHLSQSGRTYADSTYGSPSTFVDRVHHALAAQS
jgi:hypothetical protein